MNAKFVDNKHLYIVISDNGNTISNETNSDAALPHCYLNIILEEGIHHFIFISHSQNGIYLGCSTTDQYHGHFIYNDEYSCSIGINKDKSTLFGSIGNISREKYVNEIKARKSEKYEVIFNMNEHIIKIKQGNNKEILLFSNIKSPMYPFVCLDKNSSVSLLKYYKE